MKFSSSLTVLYNRETRVETCFERVPAPERFFPPKSHRFAFKLRSVKVKRSTILLVPSNRKSIQTARSSSNQKGAISKTVCGWHVRISLRITLARKLLDFDFLRGLAPGRLNGFSIGRYEKNRGSFDLNAAKFESETMPFWREKLLRRWNPFKTSFHPCLPIIKNSQRRTELHSKSLKKPLLRQKDDYTPHVR